MAAEHLSPIVVFDVNVLISGIVYGGRPSACLRLSAAGLARSFTSEDLLSQYRNKLLKRFQFEAPKADAAIRLIRRFSGCVPVYGRVKGICRDPDDDLVLDCAVEARANYIVTGDKDLRVLDPFRVSVDSDPVAIVSPAEFLMRLAAP